MALLGAFVNLLFGAFKENLVAKICVIVVSFFGILSCFVWIATLRRHFGYYDYWFSWARWSERAAAGTNSGMIQMGQRYGAGEAVQLPGAKEPIGMPSAFPRFARLLRATTVKSLAVWIVSLFGLLYVAIIAATVSTWLESGNLAGARGQAEIGCGAAIIRLHQNPSMLSLSKHCPCS